MEDLLASRIFLTFLGGLAGGAAGFAIWSLAQRFLPRPTLWAFVAIMAFVGARGVPLALSPEGAPENPQKRADPALSDAPVRSDVTVPEVFPRGTIEPASLPLIATLTERDPAFAQDLSSVLGAGPQPEAQVLSFALTYGAQAAQAYIPYAADQPILDLAEALAITTERLLQRDAKACYGWLYGGYGYEPFVFDDYFNAVGRGLIDYQLTLYRAVVQSVDTNSGVSSGADLPTYDKEAAQAAISRANFAMMQTAGVERTGLLAGERAPNGQGDYSAACTARFSLLQSLRAEENAADAIRHLYRLNAG